MCSSTGRRMSVPAPDHAINALVRSRIGGLSGTLVGLHATGNCIGDTLDSERVQAFVSQEMRTGHRNTIRHAWVTDFRNKDLMDFSARGSGSVFGRKCIQPNHAFGILQRA